MIEKAYIDTCPDEGAAVERDHRRTPVGSGATSQVFLALGPDDHQVQPKDVERVHLGDRSARAGQWDRQERISLFRC